MKKILQTLYLRVDSSSKSLTKRALAQLILKVIYSFDNPPSKEAIVNEISALLGANLSGKKTDEAFELLIKDGKITEVKRTYIIPASKKEKIEAAYNEFVNLQERIVNKFFMPITTSKNHVLLWFENVTLEFFNEYSAEWISDLCLTTGGAVKNKHRGIREILDNITDNNANLFPKDKTWLKQQYLKFLFSNDPDVYSILWDYGTSCFSSSLITANTSADPISIEEFGNSKCILDTNVLMYLDLERGKFQESFKAMEKIFIKLNITPVYLAITRDEFTRTIEHKKFDVIRIVENYPFEVIEQTDDPFLKTALYRECHTSEDFRIFFDELIDIPELLSESLQIKREETRELEEAIKNGQDDSDLKDRINNVYFSKRNRDKRKNALLHDAGLIAAAEFIRKQEKCFILSRDISINEVALEAPARNEMPIAISIDTLINVLAIDNGGTDIDPTNYAPLFASIIKLALIPERDVFKIEDLSRMLDVQSQIADLPTEKIIDIAKELHHSRVIGTSDDEISLQLTRNFQSAKLELQSDLDKSKKEIMFEKVEKQKYIDRSGKAEKKLREKYTGELRDKYDSNLRRNRILIFLVFPIITVSIIGALIYLKGDDAKLWQNELISLGINIIAWFIIDFFFLNRRIKSKYSERVNNIEDQVEARIREELSN